MAIVVFFLLFFFGCNAGFHFAIHFDKEVNVTINPSIAETPPYLFPTIDDGFKFYLLSHSYQLSAIMKIARRFQTQTLLSVTELITSITHLPS